MSSLFNHESADIVVRSSDNVDFRLHKLTLSLASPVFEGMFGLPVQGSASGDPIEVTETASTLEGVLRFCYPLDPPTFSRFDDIRLVLDAARKYDMGFVIKHLMVHLHLFLPSEAMRVYCVAYKYEDSELAQAAAACLLGGEDLLDNHGSTPEFSELPIAAFAKLTAYRKQCAKVAAEVFYDDSWMALTGFSNHSMYVSRKGNVNVPMSPSGWTWLTCESDEEICPTSDTATQLRPGNLFPRLWWHKYREAAAKEVTLLRGGASLSSVILQPHLIQPALRSAATCPTCGPKAAAELLEYIQGVAKKIEEVVKKVKIDLPF
ncbi:hypothetical protein PYCCODRAFT_1474335 [Trametes coccinea BRFM310]|uniref:BTB domain-containing protein n=1 Tax=Trametes coccinea (strain BRFM310) TaxID=1353009 RepID=A0A1Y2J0J9_TRAC3|nr:hypothetical protein PYCCODRAFT_1474335 [Trametes coccinea BRFM310]